MHWTNGHASLWFTQYVSSWLWGMSSRMILQLMGSCMACHKTRNLCLEAWKPPFSKIPWHCTNLMSSMQAYTTCNFHVWLTCVYFNFPCIIRTSICEDTAMWTLEKLKSTSSPSIYIFHNQNLQCMLDTLNWCILNYWQLGQILDIPKTSDYDILIKIFSNNNNIKNCELFIHNIDHIDFFQVKRQLLPKPLYQL